MTLLLVSVAGGIGAAARFVVDSVIARHNPFRVPLGTLAVNVTGSLLLGLLIGWAARGPGSDTAEHVKAVAGVGFCGGYTTFSTAAVETVRLWAAEGVTTGLGYAVVTLLGSIAGAAAGLWLGGFTG